MPRSPSRPATPPGYTRAMRNHPYLDSSTHDRYPPYPHPHHPSPHLQYSPRSHPLSYHHNDHSPYYRHSRGGESYYYAGSDAVSPHKVEYHPPLHYPPPPHPPAPPAPPRVHQTRQVHRYQSPGLPDPRSPPFLKYYRAPAEYDSRHSLRHVPHRPHSSWDMADPEWLRTHEDDVHGVPSSQLYPEVGYYAPSEGTGSRAVSEGPEKTPSPLDTEGYRRWEQRYSEVQSQHASSGSGSQCEDEGINDEVEQPVIDPTFTHPSQLSHSPSLHGNDAHDSPTVDTDKVSPDGDTTEDSDSESEDAGIEMPNSKKRPNAEYYPSIHHQAQFASLAKQSKKTRRKRIGLNSLMDGELDDRPSYPIPTIIKCAILGSPHAQLTLSELYIAMEERFPYYKVSDKKTWRNSVRHNLSLNNQFAKKPRPMTEPGKGHYWVVVPNMPQGNKRPRKRNKKPSKRALAAEAARLAREQELSASVSSSTGSDQNGSSNDRSQEADADIPIDPQLVGVMAGYLAPMRMGHVTVPANAGSYAAVTGAIPLPALDTQLFRPWDGGLFSTSPTHDASQPVSSALTAPEPGGDDSQRTISSNESSERPLETSLLPAASISPRRPSKRPSVFQGSGSTKDSSSHGGAQRSVTARVGRRYNPTVAAPTPSAPRNAFEALAAQIEFEGIGASGSGGPASRVRKRQPGRGIESDNDSDSSEGDRDGDLSGDEDNLRSRTRR